MVGLGFIILLVFLIAIGDDIKYTGAKNEIISIRDIAYSIQNEISLAGQVEEGYRREFEIPEKINGVEYRIENTAKQIIVESDNYDFVVTIPRVKGNLKKGTNLIRSLNGLICLGDINCYEEIPPNIIFFSPSGIITQSYVTLNVTTDEDALCKYDITETNYFNMENFFVDDITEHTASLTLGDGNYDYYATCKDAAGNLMNYSVNINFEVQLPDTEPPLINLVTPINNSVLNISSITFIYNTTDESLIANCSLVLNQSINITDLNITKDVGQNFTVNLSDNQHEWSINCTDISFNTGASETRRLKVNST